MSKRRKHHSRAAFPASTLILGVVVLVLLLILASLCVYRFVLGKTVPVNSSLQLPFSIGQNATEPTEEETTEPPTEPLVPVVIPDGVASSIRFRESYTINAGAAPAEAEKVVASTKDAKLTNRELQVYYLSEVNAYRAAGNETAPDFTLPLDCQMCPLGDGTLSWQHYFLSKAVQSWRAQQALKLAAAQPMTIPEEDFKPIEDLHEKYIAKELPVNDFIYGDRPSYKPNELHQAFLDEMPEYLDAQAKAQGYQNLDDMVRRVYGSSTTGDDLVNAARLFNLGYMFFTEKSYYVETSDEDVAEYLKKHRDELSAPEGEYTVDIRHVMLIPQDAVLAGDGKVTADDDQWKDCQIEAEKMLESWSHEFLTNRDRNANFARLANQNSKDSGSALNGGYYYNIKKGQLTSALDAWCFDEDRKEGDIAVIRSDVGIHIICLCSKRDALHAAAKDGLVLDQEQAMWQSYLDKVTVTPDYSAAAIWADPTASSVSLVDALYPDIAHERFPSAIVYLQQDYMYHPYGGSYVGRGGCGVTTMAMLATYMTDTIYTPAMLATRYPYYHDENGTNGDMFRYVPAELGFFMEKNAANLDDVITALQNGQRVISLQILGHFTRGGHYLLLQHYYEEDDTFQVRDSNVYNYGRLEGHKIDKFTRWNLLSGSANFWVMQEKITRIPACDRCGQTFDKRGPEVMMTEDYCCEKCAAALSRRNNYLTVLDTFSAV